MSSILYDNNPFPLGGLRGERGIIKGEIHYPVKPT